MRHCGPWEAPIRGAIVVVGLLGVLVVGCSAEENATSDNDRTTRGTQMMKPEQVAEAYFARMRASDLDVVNLFHEDAVLLGLGMRVSGHEAIREFYTKAIEDGRTAAEIGRSADERWPPGGRRSSMSTCRPGTSVHAVDIFHVEDGRIRHAQLFHRR